MKRHTLYPIFLAVLISSVLLPGQAAAQYSVAFDSSLPQLRFAVEELDEAVRSAGEALMVQPAAEPAARTDLRVVVADNRDEITLAGHTLELEGSMQEEGFRILEHPEGGNVVLAADPAGAMYGVLDVAEQIRHQQAIRPLPEKLVNADQKVRAIKFNLPWLPYQGGEKMDLHKPTVRDLDFWREFLDMMAKNRFNTLSLWNLHPFHYMIRAKNFPEASPFSDRELQEWKKFWKSLFKMADDRSIETYVVNWNIRVSEAMADHYDVEERNDTSDRVKQYTRESITQTINEYENLDGLGVCVCDDMRGMSPEEKEEWIYDTFVLGMRDADRPVKFIHRSVHAESAGAMRDLIDRANLPDPVKVTVKFNWSHGHSTPELALSQFSNTGEIDESFWRPHPTNYHIQWTVRNEDFFILRWGDPDFIKAHIHTNDHAYTNGYFIGSEGYIPAKEFMQKYSPYQTWQYGFQRQWMFYKMWGRLLYDSQTPDRVFVNALKERFTLGGEEAQTLFDTYRLASQVPLRIASFHRGTYDLSLYSEGFLGPYPSDQPDNTVFIGINEFINNETLDPDFMAIPDFVAKTTAGEPIPDDLVTPLELARLSEEDSREALNRVERLRGSVDEYSGSLPLELDDMATWGYLGLYLADKIRAGVALE
ncbi:MAG: hypothetical protein R3281_17950, partial [Balneolaceae bacterium]|nr:hypothetical protein [Balneolaceae bacterium]